MHVKYEPPSQPATGSITATCETTSNLPYTVGQTAEAVDDAEYTQGLAYDGVVILKDGQPITIDEVLAMLNARSGTVDEHIDKNWTHKREPCTCPPSCDYACKGECGCQACREAYGDFLSAE